MSDIRLGLSQRIIAVLHDLHGIPQNRLIPMLIFVPLQQRNFLEEDYER